MSEKTRVFCLRPARFDAPARDGCRRRRSAWQIAQCANIGHTRTNNSQPAKIAKICVRLIEMANFGAKNQENEAVQSSFHRPSAKIYQFRPKAQGTQEIRKPVLQAASAYNIGKMAAPISGGAWYHDAAIKEDDRGCKG